MKLFGIQFLICNIYISLFIILLLFIKRILKKYLSYRIQYNLWFLLFILLIIPFFHLPIHHYTLVDHPFHAIENIQTSFVNNQNIVMNQINDYAVSIDYKTLDILNDCIIFVWIMGMGFMLIRYFQFLYNFYCLKKSALPLQNQTIHKVYQSCLLEMKIKKSIPIYSTVFLETPILTGIMKPRLYLPIHLISDLNEDEIRYILLHELNHYIYKDTFINLLMNIYRVVYWLNYCVWYAFHKMRVEREIACDASVLKNLDEQEYICYGYTLLHFAKKVSHLSFPYMSEMGGNLKQLKRRIIHISYYQKETLKKKIESLIIYFVVLAISLNFIPILSTYAQDTDIYDFSNESMNMIDIDYSKQFKQYDGSFVLLDSTHHIWKIYNKDLASLRVAPYSTYKIYNALLGLEKGVITPQDSTMKWNHNNYPFQEWEQDQNLRSAMNYSVNWYFQSIDSSLGFDTIHSFLKDIQYGNQVMSHDLEMYWSDTSLKISPFEQVLLLQQFHQNTFSFSYRHIQAVKDAIFLSSNEYGSLYGKTGTGRIDGIDANGWFIGYVETSDNVYYFATYIQGKDNATGSRAAQISLSILDDLNIYKQ